MVWQYLRRSSAARMVELEVWSSTQHHVLVWLVLLDMMRKFIKMTTIYASLTIYFSRISYFLSKNAVVNITQDFGSSRSVYKTGIKVICCLHMNNCHCHCFNYQHVALCPWFVETAIVDEQTKKLVLEKSPLKFTTVDRVGEAFELAVKEQRWAKTFQYCI